jgi:hypothetical protein
MDKREEARNKLSETRWKNKNLRHTSLASDRKTTTNRYVLSQETQRSFSRRYKIVIVRRTTHKAQFSGVNNLDAGHRFVVLRRSNPRRTEKCSHFRFTYVGRMRESEIIDRYKIIIIRGTSAQSTFSGVTSLDAGHKVVVMRRSKPRRTQKRTSGSRTSRECGEARKSTDTKLS